MQCTDLFKRLIAVGNQLVYPVRRGSNMSLKTISVTRIQPGNNPEVIGVNPEGRLIKLRNLSNTVIVDANLRVHV